MTTRMPSPPPAHMPVPNPDTDRQSTSIGGRDVGKVSFSGLAEPCAIGSLVEVVINAQGATQGSVLVEAVAPTGKVHRCQVHQRGNTFTATFTPNEVGEWQIAIMYDSEHIRGSPFVCHVYDANLVKVYGLDVGVVGQELKFNVNTSHAGRGDIQVQVSHHGRSIPCYLEKQGTHLYRVQFTPDGAGHYKIYVYFNNMEVKGSPFSLDIVDASSVSVYGDNLRMASVDKLATFMIHAVGADSKDLTVTINAPSGKKKRARVVPVGDATYRVEWKPVEAGEHYIDVRLYNQPVQDGPFSCNVGDPELVTVRSMPTHIKHTELGESQSFEIDASAAGSGNLEILINGGRVSCKVKELGNRLYMATFMPVHPVTHIVEMRFNGEPVKGSPWRIEASLPSGSTETQSNVTSTVMTALGATPGGVPVLLAAPVGFPGAGGTSISNYAAYLTSAPPNFVSNAATTPTMTTFNSEIERISEDNGLSRGVGGPMWADIEGRGLTMASAGKVSSFEVGGRGLNVDDIVVRILGPNGKETPARVIAARTGNFRVEYMTADVGTYRIDLSLAGRAVDGSPFYVSSYAPQRVFIDPIPGGAVGQPVQFFVDANEAGKGQLEISVNEGRVPNSVQMQGTGRCLVTFIPENAGTYVIEVTFNGELVRGCPIRVEIYDQDGTIPASTGLSEQQRLADSIRFLGKPRQQSPVSPSRAGRTYSPSGYGAGGGSSTTYSYERREYLSNYTNGDRGGLHSSSVSYYVPGQSSTVNLTPVTATGPTGTLTRTTATIPPAPPLPPPAPTYGGQPLTKTWQRKSTPTEPPPIRPTDLESRRFEKMETKRFEAVPAPGEQKSIYQQPLKREQTPSRDDAEVKQLMQQQPYRNGSSRYDIGSPDHKSPTSIGASTRPRYTESTSMTETRREQHEYSATGLRRRLSSPERAREYDEVQRPAADRFYKFDTEGRYTPPSARVEEEREPDYARARKYFERQQAPSKSTDEQQQQPYRSEFQERLAQRAADREEKYTSGRMPDLSKVGATTVASYGTESRPIMSQGYRRPEAGPSANVLKLDKELIPMAVGEVDGGQYATVGKDTRPKESSIVREIPIQREREERYSQERPIGKDERTIREIPIQREKDERSIHREQRTIPREGRSIHTEEGLIRGEDRIMPREDRVIPREDRSIRAEDGLVRGEGRTIRRGERTIHAEDRLIRGDDRTVPRDEKSFPRDERSFPRDDRTDPRDERSFPRDEKAFPRGDRTSSRDDTTGPREGRLIYGKDGLIPGSDRPIHREERTSYGERTIPSGEPFQRDERTMSREERHLHRDERTIPREERYAHRDERTPQRGIEDRRQQETPPSWSPSSTSEPEDEIRGHVTRPEREDLAHLGAAKDGKVDVRKIKVEFPDVSDAGGGIAIVRLRKPAYFEIKPAVFEKNDLKVNITTPSKSSLDNRVRETAQGYVVEFTPTEVGTHKVHLQVGDETLLQSPCVVKVYDPDRIQVTGIESGNVGNPVQFTVDATNAGYGSLEIAIKDSDGNIIPSKVTAMQDSTSKFTVSFLPQKPDDYGIHVSFNQENLKGSPFVTSVGDVTSTREVPPVTTTSADPSMTQTDRPPVSESVQQAEPLTYMGNGAAKTGLTQGLPISAKLIGDDKTERLPKLAPVGKPTALVVTGLEKAMEGPRVQVKGPNGMHLLADVTDVGSGAYRIGYEPQTVGDHVVDVKLGDSHVQGSPFTCRVYDSKRIKVGEIPSGSVGKPVHFVVDAGEAGVGNLEVAVNEGRIPSMAHGLGQHRYDISFVPKEPSDHTISVRFNNEPVPGSPFVCKVAEHTNVIASGPGLERVAVRKTVSFTVDPQGAPQSQLQVMVKDPTGQEVPANVTGGHEKSFKVEYTPQVVGNHSIDVRCGDKPIQNSPFVVKAYDSSRVKLFPVESQGIGKTCSFYIDAARAGAGNMEIIVSVDGRNVPNFVTPEGNAKFKVSFTPQEPKQHVVSVKFNGESVPGSPMICSLFEAEGLSVIGEGISQASVGKPASFVVQASEGSENDCNVVITAPSGKIVHHRMTRSSVNGSAVQVQFIPTEIAGPHGLIIAFTYPGVEKRTFQCNVFDPSCVQVRCPKHGIVGKLMKVTADVSKAGSGVITAELRDTVTGNTLPCQVVSSNMGSCYDITFTPIVSTTLAIRVYFNGVEITNSPMSCEIYDPCSMEVSGSGLRLALVGQVASFVVELGRSEQEDHLTVTILDPFKRILPSSMTRTSDHPTKRFIEYVPKEIGPHIIDVQFAHHPLTGSPYTCNVFDVRRVKISGLKYGHVMKEQTFKIDCTDAGRGYVDVFLRNKTSTVRCLVRQLKEGMYSCAFTPQCSGPHLIEVQFNGVAVRDSPYEFFILDPSKVSAGGSGLVEAIINNISSFTVSLTEAGRGDLNVLVKAPDGGAVPVKCFQQKDGNFRVEYTPTTVGTHQVDILFGEQPITGSPFTCEVFDPNRVTVQQEIHGSINQPVSVRVTRKNAGKATLAVQVTDRNGKLLPVEVVPVSHNEDEIRFTPSVPGQHKVAVSYGGFDIADSPSSVLFNVDEPSMPSAYGEGLNRGIVNEQTSFIVDVKKLKGELTVDVTEQNGQRVKHSVHKKGDGLYETTYTPTNPGRYVVTLMWNNHSLPGSPFLVPILDPSKILLPGVSAEKAVPVQVDAQKEVLVDSSAAGPGKLRAEIRGPGGKLQTKVNEFGNSQYIVSFTPTQEGEHLLYLYWSDMPVPSCPAIYWAERGAGGGGGGGGGGARGAEGAVLVGAESYGTSPSKERRKKEGTESPSLGKDGRRELTAHCIGPNKLAYCELYGRRDGTYTLQFKPLETGRHYLHVKYDGMHVPGSPFALSVSSPPDPSKVRVYGPGVEHGILSKYKSDFTVDTQGAGAGQLTVRVRGPKGAFNVEIIRESKYDRLIRCKYEPKEPGDYQIEVKWAGNHVPGSPFLVMIFDTQQELERFLSGQPITPSPPLPFLPPGWVGPPPGGLMGPSPGGGSPPALMMPSSSPAVGFRPPPRALTYGPGPPPFPVYAGGSPQHRHHQNGF